MPFFAYKLATFLLSASFALSLIAGCAPSKLESRQIGTIRVAPFTIKVELSAAAERKLRQLHEGITVLAMFDGDALPAFRKDNSPMRDVVLGSMELPADQANTAAFTNAHISRIDWAHLSNKDYFLTINVVTSRKVDPNNLLDCTDPEDHISTFANKTTTVKCKLIGEVDATPGNLK